MRGIRTDSSREVFPSWCFLACLPALHWSLVNISLITSFLSIQGFCDLAISFLFLGQEGHIPTTVIGSLLKISLLGAPHLPNPLPNLGVPTHSLRLPLVLSFSKKGLPTIQPLCFLHPLIRANTH